MEHPARLRQFLSEGAANFGCDLAEELILKFLVYINELEVWNKKINLTGVKSPFDIIVSLFIDSLAVRWALSHKKDHSILDIGSGGGFPGIPLKIAYPWLQVTLLEPKQKKVAFLRHMVGTLGLEGVEVVPSRIQELGQENILRERFDCVVSKGLRHEMYVPYAKGLLANDGIVVICRVKPFDFSGSYFGMRLAREIPYDLPYGYGRRVLSILEPTS